MCLQRWPPYFLLSHMTLCNNCAALFSKEWSLFVNPLNLGWLHDLLRLKACSRNNTAWIPRVWASRDFAACLFALSEYFQHHIKKLSLATGRWGAQWRRTKVLWPPTTRHVRSYYPASVKLPDDRKHMPQQDERNCSAEAGSRYQATSR